MNKKQLSPYIIIIISFAAMILVGSFLLILPFATKENYTLSYIDSLFTATSAVCVTGLVSVESIASTYTLFGQIIIYLLIQIGGLGFVTLVLFAFYLLGMKIGIGDRFLLKEALNQTSMSGLVRLLKSTIIISFSIQLIGAIINFTVFSQFFEPLKAIWVSIFHAASSFNNAGFDIIGSTSLMAYKDNILLTLNTSFLIITGGIGFIVIYDLLKHKKWKKLSIHSKIVIKTTFILLLFGTLLFKITEGNNMTWLQAFFQSTAARTAGFSTFDWRLATNAGALIVCVLMYVGASPSSTGGGIKTTTLYTLYKYVISFARGKKTITHQREISKSSISKAFALIILSISFIILIILLITFIEKFNDVGLTQSEYFQKIVFEVFSAFGTVGNSMGITKGLHWLSKLLITLTMLFGRLGPITVISVLNKSWNIENEGHIKYLEEKIIIG
ncbi:MAG: potassium transporter TrkG [Bacilli bacterium]|jgi:trk system potassium uptake protein TrkH|nr:potassium transporter TrkG [Bacilli bacterium]MDD2681954.1 potassium transporter TrkG [Bacilli bacterium]MDD3121289.1 potassium transporter TrkG [Bacilli bacterium]MDD4063460.1 potassium transporter TrkG [Bacilli bacterium]MDD4482121.1 potassium transporter TrkG [Bacilli bacterium]